MRWAAVVEGIRQRATVRSDEQQREAALFEGMEEMRKHTSYMGFVCEAVSGKGPTTVEQARARVALLREGHEANRAVLRRLLLEFPREKDRCDDEWQYVVAGSAERCLAHCRSLRSEFERRESKRVLAEQMYELLGLAIDATLFDSAQQPILRLATHAARLALGEMPAGDVTSVCSDIARRAGEDAGQLALLVTAAKEALQSEAYRGISPLFAKHRGPDCTSFVLGRTTAEELRRTVAMFEEEAAAELSPANFCGTASWCWTALPPARCACYACPPPSARRSGPGSATRPTRAGGPSRRTAWERPAPSSWPRRAASRRPARDSTATRTAIQTE